MASGARWRTASSTLNVPALISKSSRGSRTEVVTATCGEVVHHVDVTRHRRLGALKSRMSPCTNVRSPSRCCMSHARFPRVPARQVVEHDDVVAEHQVMRGNVHSDEPGSAGDEDLHVRTSRSFSVSPCGNTSCSSSHICDFHSARRVVRARWLRLPTRRRSSTSRMASRMLHTFGAASAALARTGRAGNRSRT